MTDKKCVAIVGNLTEGFKAYGPFENFDEAADKCEGIESWIMTLRSPDELEDEYNG